MMALLMQPAGALMLALSVAHAAGLRYCAGVMALLISQLAGALMVVLPMVHAHAAGWCS